MKIEDSINALKRSTKYRRDYERYDAYRIKNNIVDFCLFDDLAPVCKISNEGQKLCRKYKIPYPFNPDGVVVMLPGKQTLPLENVLKIPSVLPIPVRKARDGKQVFGLIESRYLNISIDVTRPQKSVLHDIKKLYLHYKTQIETKKRRNKDSSLDCWKIFDQVKKQSKKNLLRIAKEKFGNIGNPSYSPEAAADNERVRRAYAKAQRLIREFESSS